jgi:hypothetical protein
MGEIKSEPECIYGHKRAQSAERDDLALDPTWKNEKKVIARVNV